MPTRRSLMKAAGFVSVAAAAGSASAAAGAAEALEPGATTPGARTTGAQKPGATTPDVGASGAGVHDMPRGLTLVAIKQADGRETLGVKTARGILDVAAAETALGLHAPLTLEALLRSGDTASLATLIAAAAKGPDGLYKDEATMTFGRLFTNPSKIICVGLNYKAHAEETGMPTPREPILFNKYNNALAAHRCAIDLPPKDVSTKFDYETELLVVIGKPARFISRADALSCVAGYCIGHDFSARDLQLETGGQWMVGKTLDGFAPIGPYFVSADLVGDPNALDIETRVNGETRQSSNTKHFIFDTQALIAYASRLFTLEPGDIIFTGTPPGVIIGMPKDKQVWLKAGDKIESTIEKLGTLRFDLA